jgi:diguanylate cyclase (GGDEF)-like protein
MKAAILAIDLDRFKPVNDNYGHIVGDKLLQVLAKRLALGIRGEDIVARMGGDEFILIVNAITNPEDAAKVAEKVQTLMSQVVEIDGHEIVQSASIGIAIYPDDGEDPEILMRNADKALYFSKRKGRNNYHFF